jgi:CheY-like chemotaxis protein
MKILFLHPQVGQEHAIVRGLQRRGVAVLLPRAPLEALQMLALHGQSVDLAVIHREIPDARSAGGLDLVFKIKGDPAQADLPYVLTTQAWSDAECAQHQQSATGANAYLKFPFTEAQLVQVIEAITGERLPIKPVVTETRTGITIAEATSSLMVENMGEPISLASGDTRIMSAVEHEEASVAEPPTAADGAFALPAGAAEPPTARTSAPASEIPAMPAPEAFGSHGRQDEVSLILDPGTMEVQRSEGPGAISLEEPLPGDDAAGEFGGIVLEAPASVEIPITAGGSREDSLILDLGMPEAEAAPGLSPPPEAAPPPFAAEGGDG